MSGQDWSSYQVHVTRDDLGRLLHYGHYIPLRRGYTERYVQRHFQGWTWQQLMQVWKAAGILRPSRFGAGPTCSAKVRAVHFTDATSFAVEWFDGSTTRS